MDNPFPSVSVVMPVKNESKKIAACINGILSQTVPVKEIIVVDSGSTDGTIEILERFEKVRLIRIPSSEFNHGMTRNRGVQESSSEFVVLTVGDAVAMDSRWIEKMLTCFTDDNVAGVCGTQVVPHETDKNPVAWFRPVDEPRAIRYSFKDPEEFNRLDPEEKREACAWDDVTAMYRREVLIKIPFRKTLFAEDALWAKDVLLAGYSIVINPAARVYHYHSADLDFTVKRKFTIAYHFYRFFDLRPSMPKVSLRRKLSRIRLLLREKSIPWKQKWIWYKYNQALDKGDKTAVRIFDEAIAAGEERLDEVHLKLCGAPPVPRKS